MKLKTDKFEELAKRKGIPNGKMLWKQLGGGRSAYSAVKNGCGITHEIVQNLYNRYGEAETVSVVDFGEEGLNGFKGKYISIGNQLY